MKANRLFFCGLLLSVAVLCFSVSAWSIEGSPKESEQWLTAHNTYRTLHGASPVVWSEKLAASALAYAKTCPSGHSGSAYGENLAWASYDMTIGGTVKKWYDEESLYDYENPGYVPGVGHFTQIVWKETTAIGCAHVAGCGADHSLMANTWVCHYSPPGNYRRQFPENVSPPLGKK